MWYLVQDHLVEIDRGRSAACVCFVNMDITGSTNLSSANVNFNMEFELPADILYILSQGESFQAFCNRFTSIYVDLEENWQRVVCVDSSPGRARVRVRVYRNVANKLNSRQFLSKYAYFCLLFQMMTISISLKEKYAQKVHRQLRTTSPRSGPLHSPQVTRKICVRPRTETVHASEYAGQHTEISRSVILNPVKMSFQLFNLHK